MGESTTFELNQLALRDGEIVLYQRPDHKVKKWQCRVRVPNSTGYVVKSTKTTELASAKRFAQDLWDELRLKVMAGGAIKAKNFTELFPKFCEYLKLNVKTDKRFKDITGAIERYALRYFHKRSVDQISTKDIQEFVQWRIKNPIVNETNNRVVVPSPQTVRHELSSLKRYFDWMKENGYINESISIKPPPLIKNNRPHFTQQEWNIVTRNMREWIKDKRYQRERLMLTQYMLILVNTGIRIGEARKLTWGDIDSQVRVEGKKTIADIILSVRGKTGKRDVVAKSEDLKIYLGRIWDMRKAELIEKSTAADKKKIEPSLSEYVFCDRNGKAIASFKKGFENYIRSLNLEKSESGEKRTLYSLRHTYATFRLAHGVDVYKLAKNMGTSVEMIEKFYGHTTNRGNASELTKYKEQPTKRHVWET